jgi:menaquinone-dependent protoporphyrinogen IX oxidase
MNGAITYNGKYSATRQYAEWLQEELLLPIMLPETLTKEQLSSLDFLLIGSPVYFGRLRLRKWLHEHAADISAKKLFLFIVTATTPEEQETRDKIVRDNVPDNISRRCEIFFLPGRIIRSELTWFDRMMVRFAEANIKDAAKKEAMHTDIDDVKKEHLIPLLRSVADYQAGRPKLYVH